MNFKKYLLKLSSFVSLSLISLASISCSNNIQNIPPWNYEMVNIETDGLAFNSNGEIIKFYNLGGSTNINLVIPEYLVNNRILTSEYYGYKQRITKIGWNVFSTDSNMNDQYMGSQYLNSIILPDSIEFIGGEAFYGTPIRTIIIPDSVDIIWDGTFKDCKNLTNVKLSKNTKYIFLEAFAQTSITSISFPNTLLEIEQRAFYGTKLSGVLYIPDSVLSIGNYAFYGTQITNVSIPKTCKLETNSFPENCLITTR